MIFTIRSTQHWVMPNIYTVPGAYSTNSEHWDTWCLPITVQGRRGSGLQYLFLTAAGTHSQ